MRKASVLLLFVFAFATQAFTQTRTVTTPAEQFGFEPGTDRKLADWKQLVAYYQKVASQSDRIHFQELGKTER